MKIKRPLDDCKIIYLDPRPRAVKPKAPDFTRFPHGWKDAINAPLFIEENYGIVTFGQWVVLDIDKLENVPEDVLKHINSIPADSWKQKTAKGTHYLFSAPLDSRYHRTVSLNANGEHYGDIKGDGYIVGPGSTIEGHCYELLGSVVYEAPRWLLDLYNIKREIVTSGQSLDGIYNGNHDNALIQLSGFMRGKLALSETAILEVLEHGVSRILKDVNPSSPYTRSDFLRIARSAGKYEPDIELSLGLNSNDIEQGVDFDFPLFDWYIHGFIPRGGYLVTAYAPGGTGKSSFGQYLSSLITNFGDNFLVFNHEDTPQVWKAGAVMAGAQRERLFSHKKSLAYKTPRDTSYLEEVIKENNIKAVWFDSVKDHFPTLSKGGNDATVSRSALSPLAELASRLGVLIIGIFHTNKAGLPSGSSEMLNVARHVLEFKRKEDEPLTLKVEKTNIYRPGYMLSLPAVEMEIVDPLDPTKKYVERNEDGSLGVRKTWVIQSMIKDSELLKKTKKEEEEAREIRALVALGKTQRQIAKELGISLGTVNNRLKSAEALALEDV